jgi:hypothetical protein
MTTKAPEQNRFRFPRAFMSASRDELTVELTVKDKQGNAATLPDDLHGHVFIMSFAGTVAAKRVENCEKATVVLPGADGMTALFDGDGMVYRIDFHTSSDDQSPAPGKAGLKSRLIKTPAFFADKITHDSEDYKFLRFTDFGIIRLSLLLGICHQINTAFQPFKFAGDRSMRLLATNDVNRPYEIDPCTLKITAPVGLNQDWESLPLPFESPFPFLVSSAHPCFDAQAHGGELFSINVLKSLENLVNIARFDPIIDWLENHAGVGSPSQFRDEVFLVRWNQKQGVKLWPVKYNGKSIKIVQSTHMIGITEHYVILADTAMKTEQTERIILLISQILDRVLNRLQKIVDDRRAERRNAVRSRLASVGRFIRHGVSVVTAPIRNLLPHRTETEDDSRIRRAIESLRELRERRIEALQGGLRSIIDRLLDYLINRLIRRLRKEFVRQQDYNTPLYIIHRDQLDDSNATQINAQKVVVEAPFVHFLTDYSETPEGKIVLTAPLTYALDPAEYINEEDSCYFRSYDISDLTGMVPAGVDISVPALVVIDPNSGQTDLTYEMYSLPKEEALKYTFFIGLYAYRDNMPLHQLDDIYWVAGGAWPELLTEFIYNLYKNYATDAGHQPQEPAERVKNQIGDGVPMMISHMHIDRSQLSKQNPQPLSIQNHYIFDPTFDPQCPPNCMVFAIQFVPRVGSTAADDGYLVCTVVHSDHYCSTSDYSATPDWSENSEIWIFDTKELSAGPKYKLSHPQINFGMTLHSTWLETLEPAPDQEYSVRDDYQPSVDKLIKRLGIPDSPDDPGAVVQRLFDQVYEEFETYRTGKDKTPKAGG